MPYRRRKDAPNEWFHVMNRAIARRTMFERRADMDAFLGHLEAVVAKGWLEVHAYSVMATHFHLLVRSPDGELSRAMRELQLGYVRHFNRTRRRDGPLLRGRFRSKFVGSLAYRRLLVGYIDDNAPRAGLVANAAEYAFGSARAYVTGTGPSWLSREWVQGEVRGATGSATYRGADYPHAFHRGFSREHAALIDQRILATARDTPIDDLIDGAPARVLAWFRYKARLADGTKAGLPLVSAACAITAIGRAEPRLGIEPVPELGRLPWRTAATAFLLRELAGLSLEDLADRLGKPATTAARALKRARAAVRDNARFAVQLATIAKAALFETFGHLQR